MAETYKGLTVRIGGDATGLQKTLTAVQKAASQTDTQLRKMKQALSMDDTNMDAVTSTVELLGQRAMEASTRLTQLRSSLREIGGQRIELFDGSETKTIEELAAETQNAAMRAGEAKKNYNEVTEELAKVRNEIEKVANVDLSKMSGAELDEFVADLSSAGKISQELADRFAELRVSYKQAFDENEIASTIVKFQDLNSEVTKADSQLQQLAQRLVAAQKAATQMKLGGNVDEQLRQIDSAAQALESEMKQVDEALKLNPNNVEALALKMRDLQESSELSRSKVELLQQQLREMDSQGIGKMSQEMGNAALEAERAQAAYTETTLKVKQLEGEIEALSQTMQTLKTKGQMDSDEYVQAKNEVERLNAELQETVQLNRQASEAFDNATAVGVYRQNQSALVEAKSAAEQADKAYQNLSKSGISLSSTLTSLGMSLMTTVTPAVLSMGYEVVSASQEIDSAYRDMRKTVNGTEEDFQNLKQAAMDFSTTHVTSADQILSIQAIGGELGVATEALDTFAETVSNLEIATNLNADEAATSLGQLSNIMNDLDEETMPNFADALVRLGNNGASTESQIADIASRIGSMGSILGFTTPEILAWASTIASTGQGTEAAGTAIANTMSAIESAAAGGADSVKGFADVAGMAADDFIAAWNTDPSSVFEAFIKGLVRVEEAGGSATATLDGLDIRAARQVQAIEGLMQTVGMLDDNIQMSNDAWQGISDEWGEAGDAAREASAKAEGFSGQLSIMQNVVQNLASEFGDALVPVMQGVTDFAQGLYDVFSQMPTESKQFVTGIAAIVGAAGPLILLGNSIGSFFTKLADGIKKTAATKSAASAVGKLSSSLQNLTGAAGTTAGVISRVLVGGGIMVAVAAFGFLLATVLDVIDAQNDLTESTEGLADVTKRATSLDTYSSSLDEIALNADKAAMSVNELADSNARHVETMRKNVEQAEEQIGTLSSAQDIINRYAGQTDLTASAEGQLAWAIEQVNEQFGLTLTAADVARDAYRNANGDVVDLTDSINKLIDAKKNEARVSVLTDNLTEAYKAQADSAATLADVEQRRQGYIDKMLENGYSQERATSIADQSYGIELDKAQSAFDSATQSVSQYEAELGYATRATSEFADEYDNLSNTMGSAKFDLFSSRLTESGTNIGLLAGDLRALGADVQQFSDLNDSELQQVAEAYDGTASSLIDSLDKFGVSISDAGREAASKAKDIKDALTSLDDTYVTNSIESMGYSLSDFSQKLADAGITSSRITDDIGDDFSLLVQLANGDINKLIYLIQNYNSTPIFDKEGNINVTGTDILLYANDQVYTWNGTNLIDNKTGNIVIQGLPELHDANGQIYTWNNQGELIDQTGNVVINATTLYDTNEAAYEFDGMNLYKDGAVYVDQLELTDAYDNMVKLDNDKLVTSGLNGTVNVDYDDVKEARGWLDGIRNTYAGKSLTYTVNVLTNYKTNGTPSNYTSSVSPGWANRSAAPSSLSSLVSRAATPAMMSLSDDVSDMATKAGTASLMAARANTGIDSIMSNLAGNQDYYVNVAAGVARSSALSGSGAPGNRTSLSDARNGGTTQNIYEITVDGNGTSARVQEITLQLLDQLEKEARL